MRIVNQPVQDAISQRRIADLFMPARPAIESEIGRLHDIQGLTLVRGLVLHHYHPFSCENWEHEG